MFDIFFSPRPPCIFNTHNHFLHSLIFTFCSIYIYYCLHYILIPTQFIAVYIAKCMVFVTTVSSFGSCCYSCCRFFLGWANVCSFFSFRSVVFFHTKTVLLSIHFIWLLRCVCVFCSYFFFAPYTFDCFCKTLNFPYHHYVQRLNKLPKVYYVLLLFGILLLSFVIACIVFTNATTTTTTAVVVVVFAEFFFFFDVVFENLLLANQSGFLCMYLCIDFNGFLHALFASLYRMYISFQTSPVPCLYPPHRDTINK